MIKKEQSLVGKILPHIIAIIAFLAITMIYFSPLMEGKILSQNDVMHYTGGSQELREYYNNERPHTGKYCYGKTPIQTWKESIHLAKEKILSNHYLNIVSLSLSGEMETGSAGKQPVCDNLTDWNGHGGQKSPLNPLPIPRNYGLENPSLNL